MRETKEFLGERRDTRCETGFSLIELLIVVTVILILAAMAIPNYLRSRLMANEASAVHSMRAINTAEVSYATSYGLGYAPGLGNLAGATPCAASPATACLIDPFLGAGTKSGYSFKAVPNTGAGTALSPFAGVEVTANPLNVGTTGQRSFCSDQSGAIRFDATGAVMGTGAAACAAIPAAQVLQ
jgi:type IV pilus assembly protein PilA